MKFNPPNQFGFDFGEPEEKCFSNTGNCVNSNICQELNHCMFKRDEKKTEPTAEQLKQQGMQQAVNHAENEIDGWKDHCFELFGQWLAQFPVGHRFLMEEFNTWALENGLETPPSLQAFGHLPGKAARKKMIYATDQVTKGKTQRSHAGLCRVWEKILK